jgi:hypothetical protein
MRTFTLLLLCAVLLMSAVIPAFATSGFNSWLVREKVKRPFGTDKKVTIAIDTREEIGELRYVNTLDPAAGQDRQSRIPYANILIQLEQGLPAEVRGDRDQD